MIDRKRLWSTVLVSWGYTCMGVFNIAVLCVFAAFIALRLAGPGAVVAIIMPSLALMTAVFFLGEVLVNTIFRAKAPHPEKDERFIRAMKQVSRKARMWIRPRGWIVEIGGKPNAMAYGPGIPGLCAVAVSRELVDMLTDEELEGVIAHEFAHIRCRDTGILAVIGMILGVIDKLHKLLASPRSLFNQSPVLMVFGWVLYGISQAAFYISRFSISQEREIAADALGAWYIGDSRPLISALKKLHAHGAAHRGESSDEPILHDLMLAHPGLEERIASLESIMKKEEVAS
ncbi:MAG: M48 family metalloprotease [Candidatus Pacebacteria bacterium]|nr:M48 family metalloprotease [Candidatus Paceibacterota bacterium]